MKKRKTGPSAPCAGWARDQQQAEADAGDPQAVVAALRVGTMDDTEAYRQLRYLLYAELPDDLRKAEALYSFYWEGLATAIARLRKNDATDPVAFIRDEFRRKRVKRFKADSSDIRPSRGDKAADKREGKTSEPLRKIETKAIEDEDGYTSDSLLDVPTFDERDSDMIDGLAFTELERDVLALAQQGESIREMATKMQQTKYRIEATLNTIRARARRLGIDLPEQDHRAAG